MTLKVQTYQYGLNTAPKSLQVQDGQHLEVKLSQVLLEVLTQFMASRIWHLQLLKSQAEHSSDFQSRERLKMSCLLFGSLPMVVPGYRNNEHKICIWMRLEQKL